MNRKQRRALSARRRRADRRCAFVATLLTTAAMLPSAYAQTNPGFVFGQVPSAAQWNGYFSGKVDVTNGSLQGGVTLGPNAVFNVPTITFAGPIVAPNPIFSQFGTVKGTMGNGGTIEAPRYASNVFEMDDFITNNYSNQEVGWQWTENLHSVTGGRNMANMTLNQLTPITPDNNPTIPHSINPSFSVLNLWSSWNNIAGGTVDNTGKVTTFGLLYGKNEQMLLKSAQTPAGTAAAQYFTLANLYGEGDLAIQGPTRQLVLSGTVTVGDTETIHIASSVNPGFGNVDLVYTNVTGDTLALITQKLGNLVLQNQTLALNDVGMGVFGATDLVNPTVLNFYWPAVTASHTTDIAISISQNVGCTETLTLGAPVLGASTRSRFGGSTLILRSGSVGGYGADTWWAIGKQGSGSAATSGAFQHLFIFGGLGNDPDNLDQSVDNIEPAQPPFVPDSDLFVYVKPNSFSNGQDAPTQNLQLHSVFDFRNVNFTAITKNGTPGGPLLFPGYELYGDGSQQIGGAALLAKHGAGNVGLAITASGTVATSATLVAGGGGSTTLDLKHRYYVGETEAGPYGDMWRVDSIGTLGDVVTFSAVCDGATEQHCTYASVPAGVTPASTATLDAGSGEGWIIGYNWAPANTITIGGAGQTINLVGNISKSGSLNLIDYGGDPTGVADSTTALTNVCTAAVSAGKDVYAPSGTYLLDGASLSGCSIVGDGPPQTIFKRKASAAAGYVLQFSAVGNWGVSNLTIDGNKANESVSANSLNALSTWGGTLSNISVVNAKSGHGIRLLVLADAAHSTKTVLTNVQVDNNDLEGIHQHGLSQDLTISGGGGSGNGGAALIIENNGTYPVPVASILRPVVRGFRALGNTGGGILLQGFCGSASVSVCVSGYDTMAIDQAILDGNFATGNAKYGIVAQVSNGTVVNNHANSNGGTGSTYAGILANAAYTTFDSNTVNSNEFYGFDAGGCFHCVFSHNHINTNGNNTANSGIGLNLEATQFTIADANDLSGNGTAAVGAQIMVRRDGGTGTTTIGGCKIGFNWSGNNNSVINNKMTAANTNQYGVWVIEDPQYTTVKNNHVSGNDTVKAFWLASTLMESKGNTTDNSYPIPIGIGLGSTTLNFPDWYERLQIDSAPSATLTLLAPNYLVTYLTSVYKILVTAPGSGYSNPTISGLPGGATGEARCTEDGKLANIRVTAPGTGASPGTGSATITDGTGTGAAATYYVRPNNTLLGRKMEIDYVAAATSAIVPGPTIQTPNNVPLGLVQLDNIHLSGWANGTTSALWRVDSITNLMGSTGSSGPPTDNGCNTATAVGNSKRGTVTVPAGVVTSCAMSWATPAVWGSAPFCTVGNFSVSGDTGKIVATTSGFTVTLAASIGGGTFDYSCEP